MTSYYIILNTTSPPLSSGEGLGVTESKFIRILNIRTVIANLVILLLAVGLIILFALEVVGGWVFIIVVPIFIYLIINFISTIISIPKLLNAIRLIFTSPKYLGRFIFDVLGKGDKSADFSNIVMGYAIVFVPILILLGIIDLDFLVNIWRFFFPNKP